MKLTKKISTEDVKRKFNDRFPMLKIEFYNKKHKTYSVSAKENLITSETDLGILNPAIIEGEMDLDELLTVRGFEENMEHKFGLHVQVFRKSGEQWMQTSITDDWTLKKQEENGENQDQFISQRK